VTLRLQWEECDDSQGGEETEAGRSVRQDHIAWEGLSQTNAAKLLGVTQPRISDLMRGRIDLFAIDTLVNMLATAGLRVEMHIAKAA
jgi:predicted XRE-type DNA-binding protein